MNAHDPVDDAKGNAEAFFEIIEEVDLKIKL